MTPVGSARERFPIKFYLIAMLFIVFDIETIFLYPWAATYQSLPYAMKLFEFIEMAIFVAILFVGYFYILGKGALDWDESEQARAVDVLSPQVLAPRPAIRFGNEDSGPVRIPSTADRPAIAAFGANAEESQPVLL